MKIQIIDGKLTYFSKGFTLGSTLETTEEIDNYIKAIENYCLSQRTPEQIAIEIAEEKRVKAKENAIEAIQREQVVYNNLQKVLQLVRVDELTEEELSGMIDLYPDLEMNKWYDDYKTDPQYYKWQGNLYKIEQGHTTQHEYNLDELPALYTKVVPKNIIRKIPDPITVGEAFVKGEKGIWVDGKIYESTLDKPNTWTPTDYPQAWKLVE